jgi:hypothetical protein
LVAFFAAGISTSLPKSVALASREHPCLSKLWMPNRFRPYLYKNVIAKSREDFRNIEKNFKAGEIRLPKPFKGD